LVPSPSINFRTAGSAGSGEYLETRIETDHELRRNLHELNRTELRSFDLARVRVELARRIDFGLDAAAGILFQHGGVAFEPDVRNVVNDCVGIFIG
jgi:hypothetical protein